MQQQINDDLDILISHLSTLKTEFDAAISEGKSFLDVKVIHLQIKELSGLIERLKQKNERDYMRAVR